MAVNMKMAVFWVVVLVSGRASPYDGGTTDL
jgi:hypothetical protein